MSKAIGIIETRGYAAALRAADMMLKMAYVDIVKQEQIGSGLVTTIIEGDIASVKEALDYGAEAAQSTGELVAVHSIAKPLIDLKGDRINEAI
ncbi:BMC domain-containing protein [Clostridium swellfunianum]|uniref:BMC domain-containing protein n=1 Tax=Clostridium swellfunianum TaxID=1367462 RepID=UPI00202E841E|nr:BMC domain-containing protein [Clostridium swellfunianum]MCM0649232.1 BMC domain-containing protein [Clostridium swellfunianum]